MASKPSNEPLIDETAAGALLGVTRRCMQAWRARGEGPRYTKLGQGKFAPVRYRPADLRAYVEDNLRQTA